MHKRLSSVKKRSIPILTLSFKNQPFVQFFYSVKMQKSLSFFKTHHFRFVFQVLILGAGYVSAPVVDYLTRDAGVGVTVAAALKEEANKLAKR
jgi:alpha-aminoadipic semialdehyde synthase